MPVVVGFTFPGIHDNAACAIVDGKLVFAAEEERYTRHKYSVGDIPQISVARTLGHLASLGIGPEDVDAFAINWDLTQIPMRNLKESAELFLHTSKPLQEMNYMVSYPSFAKKMMVAGLKGRTQAELARLFIEGVYRRMGARFPKGAKVIPILHHLSHAASAFYFSGFDSCAVLTIDARGETDSTVLWDVKSGEFERIATLSFWEGSIGEVYSYVSMKLGFDELSGPGKVMGLAPYGSHKERLANKFANIGTVCDGGDSPYKFSSEFRRRNPVEMYTGIANFLSEGLELSWSSEGELCRDATDLAFNLQEFTENLVVGTGRWSVRATNRKQLAMAGGVALNAKANMMLYYSRMFEDVWVFPAANDAGSAIGAAAYVHQNVLGGKMKHGRLESLCLGEEYDDDVVSSLVERSKFRAKFIGSDTNPVAQALTHGAVVGWWQGRSEFGPRALGNRSIVADPTKKESWRAVNAIKGRELWRPLAPSVLEGARDTYLEGACDHKFMVMMFRMNEQGSARVPAVCHVDRTTRPQVVSRADNETWYDLIKAFGDLTGDPILLNTSFNLAGEPLVQTPEHALRSFAISGLDALYLQGWLIEKSGN